MKNIATCISSIALIALLLLPELSEAKGPSGLNIYERGIAYAIDKAVASIDYDFEDVLVVTHENPVKQFGPMSIGEAMMVNEQLHRGVSPNQFVASMVMNVTVKGHPYGKAKVRWNPSRDLMSLVVGMLLFRLDRSYVWPQFVLDRFPNWFKPQMHAEPFEIDWYEIGQLLDAPEDEEELDFLSNIVTEMRILNPEVNSLSARGNVIYYGDRRMNRTQFVFEVITDFPGALACEQRVRTDYNPFAEQARVVKGAVACRWSEFESIQLKGNL